MTLALTQFVTLDGVSQGPGSPTEDPGDGFTRGGWLVPHMDETFVRRASEWLDRAGALLLGRRTYEAFARDWPAITDPADPFAGRMNTLPKYVVSRTLRSGSWSPTTVLNGVAEVGALREGVEGVEGEVQIHGSAVLAGALLGEGMVDVLRLVLAPTVLGQGRRLLAHPSGATGWRVAAHEMTPAGLMLLEYERVGAAAVGEFSGVTDL